VSFFEGEDMRNLQKLFFIGLVMGGLYARVQAVDLIVNKETGPYYTIQEAYDAANPSGDAILLTAEQTFTGAGNKNILIQKDLSLGRIGDGSDPIVDLAGSGTGNLCIIFPDYTVTMSNLVIVNGYSSENGGAVNNSGTFYAFRCTFSNNSAVDGGAIYNDDGIVDVSGCTFSNNNVSHNGGALFNDDGDINVYGCIFNSNSASSTGGAIFATCPSCKGIVIRAVYTNTIHCSRFTNNSASSYYAIFADYEPFDATNNWWGSNTPDAATLFGDSPLTYAPWITLSVATGPAIVLPGGAVTFTATFSPSCIPDGTPVAFTITDGTITPTVSSTINGQRSAIWSNFYAEAEACVTTDSQMVCTTVNAGHARYNYGCVCTDTGDQHILIGAYNDPLLENNQLLGCIFDSSSSTTTAFGSLNLGAQLIYSVAVYNYNEATYIALLTKNDENYYLYMAVAVDSGSGYAFTLGSPVTLAHPATKIQWITDGSGRPYVAVDTQSMLTIYQANINTLSLMQHSTIANVAGSMSSSFLYWTSFNSSLYLVQGFNGTHVATYRVNPNDCTFEGIGVDTQVSDHFTVANGCSTCANYLAVCGQNNSSQGIVARYQIASNGTLAYISSAQVDSATNVYYCERCCCNADHLLVGTDTGLYTINATSYAPIASNTSMPDNAWINVCWCCDSIRNYCAATDSSHGTYIFRENGSNLQEVVQL
jgi:predicted outer membrane repeat protein